VEPPSFVPLPPKKVKGAGPLHNVLLVLSIATTLAGLAGVFAVLVRYQAGEPLDDTLEPSVMPRRVLTLALLGLMNLFFAFAIRGWRRWGVYGILIVSLFAFMENWRIGGAVLALPGVVAVGTLVVCAGIVWVEFD
jgi:hypothetical protein